MRSKEILLVDDDPGDRELTLRALEATGLEARVQVARNGEEALAVLFPDPPSPGEHEPKLILLDLELPGAGGLEVLRAIRSEERTALLPAVILTSVADPRRVAEAYRSGANSYVVKETDAETFSRRIAQIATYWLTCNRSPA